VDNPTSIQKRYYRSPALINDVPLHVGKLGIISIINFRILSMTISPTTIYNSNILEVLNSKMNRNKGIEYGKRMGLISFPDLSSRGLNLK
jgi:hypothetical protein